MSWNLDLCLSVFDEPQTPFRYLVFPWTPTPSPLKPFHRFADLPAEVYLRILQFCDASTLFQLMHTCSYIRPDASKAFWTQQDDIWYQCDRYWLQALCHGRVGMVKHCAWF